MFKALLSKLTGNYKVAFFSFLFGMVISLIAGISGWYKMTENKIDKLEASVSTVTAANTLNKATVGELKLSNEINLDTERKVVDNTTKVKQKIDTIVADRDARVKVQLPTTSSKPPVTVTETTPKPPAITHEETISRIYIESLWKIYCAGVAHVAVCQ